MLPKPFPFIIIVSIACLFFIANTANYNQSVCADIQVNGLHYYINEQEDNIDLTFSQGNEITKYNFCQQVQVYCPYSNYILQESMVIVNHVLEECISLQQSNVDYFDGQTSGSGLKVTYTSLLQNRTVQMNYPCDQTSGRYCPEVEAGIVFEYFNRNVVTYTIIIEIIGVILMVFGIYIYRGSIVLIGWGTAFVILIFIESFFIFVRGIPNATINLVLILTIVTSFFVGYTLGYFPKAGLFCMGMWIGIILTLTLNNICLYFIDSNPQNLSLFIVMPILAIGFGVLILFIKKTFIVFASSLIGAYFCLRALSWSLGAFPNEFLLSKQYHKGLASKVPWQFYLYVIALLILTASSSALQFWLFKKKMRKNKESGDFEQHLNQMESSLNKEKQRMFEIRDVFKSQGSNPKVLRKTRKGERRKQIREDSQIEERGPKRGLSNADSLPADQDSEEYEDDSEDDGEVRPDLKQKLLVRKNLEDISKK